MDNKITFPELIDLVAQTTNTSKRMSELFLKELFATISQSLINGETVKIKNLGVFKMEDVKSRKSVSVNTGQEVEIPMHRRMVFTPAKSLADAVNEPFAHFETVTLSDDVTDDMLANITTDEAIPALPDVDEVDTEVDEVAETPAAEVVTPPPFMPMGVMSQVELPAEEPEPVDVPAEESAGEPEPTEELAEEPVEEPTVVPAEESAGEPETEVEEPVEEVVEEPEDKEVAEPVDEVEEPAEEQDSNEIITEEDAELDEDAPTPATYSIMEFEKEKRRIARNNLLKGMVLGALAMLLVVFIAWSILDNGMFNGYTGEVIQADTIASDSTELVTDSVAAPAADTTATTQVKEEEAKPAPEAAPATPVAPAPAKVAAGKVVTDTTTRTLYLTRMAKKHYGNKDFWVYIYEENKGKISNPNTVPPGTVLVIPPAAKYGIDANNKESLAKARELQSKLFAQFATKKK